MRQLLLVIFVNFILYSPAFAQPSGKGFVEVTEEDASPSCFGYQIKVANTNLTDNLDGTCSIADQTGAGGGDEITVNTTAATNANFLDNLYIDGAIDTAATPDDITFKFNYAETLAGNPALLTTEVIFTADGLLAEGTTADAIELKLAFPDPVTTDKTITFFNATDTVVGKDTTDTLTNKTMTAAANVLDADTAVALAADPANCAAGSVAGGVTAAGVAESCLDPIVSTEIDTSAEILAITTDETGTGALTFATSPTFTTSIAVNSTDPADAGAIRLNNAENIAWEASPAGTDITLGLDSLEELLLDNAVGLGLDDQTDLRFYETDANGSNYLAFEAPAAITTTSTCTLENDGNPIPDSCVGDGTDAGGTDTNAVKEYWWPASASLPLEVADSIPPISKDAGTNIDQLTVDFDDSTDECRTVSFKVPSDVTSGSTITFRAHWYSAAATTGDVILDFRHNGGVGEGVDPDAALTVEASVADTTQGTAGQLTVTTWTETLANLGWAANEQVDGEFCRDANHASDTLVGDEKFTGFGVEIPRS